MPYKKVLSWVTAFSILSAFTLATLNSALADPAREALSEIATVDQAGNVNVEDSVIIKDEGDASGAAQSLFGNPERQFIICSANKAQLDALSSRFSVNVTTVKVRGKKVKIVDLKSEVLTQRQLERYLVATGDNRPDCQVVKVRNHFFFLFSGAHVS